MNDSPSPHPYSALTPDTVLDAVESAGFLADGRQLALNSYENRVYQVGLEEGHGGPLGDARFLVAKFYRPGRWSDEQILEEHGFARELARPRDTGGAGARDRRDDAASPRRIPLCALPRRGGRAPELEDPGTLEWLGRFIGRIHAVGASKPFLHRPALDVASFGTAARDWLLEHDFIPADLRESWSGAAALATEGAKGEFGAQSGNDNTF